MNSRVWTRVMMMRRLNSSHPQNRSGLRGLKHLQLRPSVPPSLRLPLPRCQSPRNPLRYLSRRDNLPRLLSNHKGR